MHQVPNERMKGVSISSLSNNPVTQDLLWISKQQQQHPSIHAHPLKNAIRVNSRGIRFKFDGKQWRSLCQSPDGYECRNLVFRSSLCQKHFYKIHLFKRPYAKNGSISSSTLPTIPPLSLKRSLPNEYEHHHHQHQLKEQNEINDELEEIYEEDDPIEVIENNDVSGQKMNIHSLFIYILGNSKQTRNESI
jgi:hypothetical protein